MEVQLSVQLGDLLVAHLDDSSQLGALLLPGPGCHGLLLDLSSQMLVLSRYGCTSRMLLLEDLCVPPELVLGHLQTFGLRKAWMKVSNNPYPCRAARSSE